MLDDPEKEPARWDEPIIADSSTNAKRECQKRADRYQVELESVSQPKKPQAGKKQIYRCNYKEKTE